MMSHHSLFRGMFRIVWLGLAAWIVAQHAAPAATMSLTPIADTTLWQSSLDFNMGGEPTLVAGTRAQSSGRMRALIKFDLSALETGATIESATLTLTVTKLPRTPFNSTFELRHVTAPWGEGDNVGRTGSTAQAGEATWRDRIRGTAAWTTQGGDFAAVNSGTVAVAGLGQYVFSSTSTPQMVSDLQSWYQNADGNFGWMLMTQSETVQGTARRFGSSESGVPPRLTITYSLPQPGDVNFDKMVNRVDLAAILPPYGTSPGAMTGDLTGDGAVSLLDLASIQRHFGEPMAAGAPDIGAANITAVPEPCTLALLTLGVAIAGLRLRRR